MMHAPFQLECRNEIQIKISRNYTLEVTNNFYVFWSNTYINKRLYMVARSVSFSRQFHTIVNLQIKIITKISLHAPGFEHTFLCAQKHTLYWILYMGEKNTSFETPKTPMWHAQVIVVQNICHSNIPIKHSWRLEQ